MKRILVIDDEKLIVKSTCILLRHMGYETIEAYDGETGFTAARESSPDLILLDMNMPGEDAWEVLGRLKYDPATAEVPVVALTSNGDADSEVIGPLRGLAVQIRKPSNPEDLEEIIRQVEGREED